MKRYPPQIITCCTLVIISIFCLVSTASSLQITNDSFVKTPDGSFVSNEDWSTFKTADFTKNLAQEKSIDRLSDAPNLDNVLTMTLDTAENLDFEDFSENDLDGSTSLPVPEPATILLLGAGLIGLAEISRIYSKKG